MKSTFEWHALQDGFVRLLEQMSFLVGPVPSYPIRVFPISVLPVRRKSTASQVTASYPPDVAPDCCGKHHTLWIPARALRTPRKDLRVLVPNTGDRNPPRMY